ncbi:MFS transporter [Lutimonas sp.]|uniref:MFS transporter n=1 Tax=Lutimonas sp. TaxID=1872403 RepID=UPI003D9B1E33
MKKVVLGLRSNWKQFVLLVIVNTFVGGMVGMERTILPQLAEEKFHLTVHTAILSFIIIFGVSKAITNYFTGVLSDRIGRRKLLILGWIIALPIPLILIYAPNWSWVIFANLLLGINQGLTWSSTVVMKIDLVGEKNRGLAMGFNESAGYLAVGAVAFLTGWVASNYGLSPYPFYIGILLSILGLLFSIFFIKDTRHHVAVESEQDSTDQMNRVFWETTWANKNLGSITQAGMVNNLNDGMVWGLFPILLASLQFDLEQIGMIVSVYPAVWGVGQLFTGRLADILPKRTLLFWGMLLQGIALGFMAFTTTFLPFVLLSIVLGIGTALVYPTFLAGIASYTSPVQRAESIGVFRLWRDLGYAIGAVLTGVVADMFGITYSIAVIAVITLISSLIIRFRMEAG